MGSIDAYILATPDSRLQSDVAIELRQLMAARLAAQSAHQRRQQQKHLPPAAAAALEAAAGTEAA